MIKMLFAGIIVAWLAFAVFCPEYAGKMHQLMGLYDNPFKQTETTE